ncbi:MAG: hypothetical protein KAG43_09980, partial [Candidatus Marithrix sp.]|nr:hypothetical protein [Candidatus Marithrix sp.]
MNFKKTVLASAIALAVSGGSVLAKTSTVDGAFILDKTTVRGGDVINLALLGLDEKGEVDLYGEKDGSVIIAVVRSEIGEVIGGSINPGELPRDAVEGGNFAAGVKYVKLTQGTGRVHVAYEADTEGTDTLKVELLERTANAAGGVDFIVIESTTKTITVAPITSSDPLGLDITGFLASASDAKGKGDCIGFGGRNEACIEIDKDGNMSPDWMPADGMPNNGIMGAMTAGKAGGQIFVQAINPVAVGDVTVTLRKKSGMDQCPTEAEVEPISYTARMQRGQASVTLDDKVIKAGSYYIEATFTDLEGKPFSGDSVDLFYSDTVMVQGTGEPNGLVLCSDKTIVTKAGTINSDGSIDFPNGTQAAQGTHVKAIVVDEFGNVTSNNTGEDIIVNVSDANGLFKALSLTVPNNVAESIASDESLPATDSKVGNSAGEILEIGTTSLVATAINGSNEPVVGITVSDPLEIKVVDYSLIVSVVEQDVPNGIIDTFATSSRLAGTEFDAFTVVAADSNGLPVSNPGTSVPLDPGVITI